MAAYVVVLDYEIHDQQLYESVTSRIAELVEAHGGKYLARSAPLAQGGRERFQQPSPSWNSAASTTSMR